MVLFTRHPAAVPELLLPALNTFNTNSYQVTSSSRTLAAVAGCFDYASRKPLHVHVCASRVCWWVAMATQIRSRRHDPCIDMSTGWVCHTVQV
jgi:hypothetical protein